MNSQDEIDFTTYQPVRSTDPETSFEAAHAIMDSLPHLEGLVLDAIKQQGSNGATIWEVINLTSIENQTCSPRFAPLRRKGLIEDAGERRKGGTNRKQIVWVATNRR